MDDVTIILMHVRCTSDAAFRSGMETAGIEIIPSRVKPRLLIVRIIGSLEIFGGGGSMNVVRGTIGKNGVLPFRSGINFVWSGRGCGWGEIKVVVGRESKSGAGIGGVGRVCLIVCWNNGSRPRWKVESFLRLVFTRKVACRGNRYLDEIRARIFFILPFFVHLFFPYRSIDRWTKNSL